MRGFASGGLSFVLLLWHPSEVGGGSRSGPTVHDRDRFVYEARFSCLLHLVQLHRMNANGNERRNVAGWLRFPGHDESPGIPAFPRVRGFLLADIVHQRVFIMPLNLFLVVTVRYQRVVMIEAILNFSCASSSSAR